MTKKLVLYILCLFVMKITCAQVAVLNTKIAVNYQNTIISEILEDISRNYSINFYYNASIADLQKPVSISMDNVTLKTVLDKMFENTTLVFQTEGNRVLLNTATKKDRKAVIHGYITDANSKETLIGATIVVKNTTVGTITNSYGFYSLTVPELPGAVTFSFIGYNDTTIVINSINNISLNIALSFQSITMEEVIVNSDKSNVNNSQTGFSRLSMNDVKALPAFMGETDIIKTMQLTTGVKTGNEASSGFYVRGGGPDQNLVLLDGATLYNTSHSMNLFSIFNPDAIKNVEISKSGFPARYGGRLSSVLDVKMKDGNMEKYQGELALGYLTSKLTLEGPIVKGKTSFIVSCRRSFFDLFTRWNMQIDPDTLLRLGFVFYDASVKVNHKFSDKDRLFASFCQSGDGFMVYEQDRNQSLQYTNATNAKIRWSNLNGAFRWNHMISDKLFANTTLSYSRFKLYVLVDQKIDYSDISVSDYIFSNYFGSTIEDFGIRTDFDYFPNSNHSIKYGFSAQTHTYLPGESDYKFRYENTSFDTTFRNNYYSNDFFWYAEDDMEITEKLKANIGLHGSLLIAGNKMYPSLQPRISVRYSLSPTQSVKASYSKMSQYIHLLTGGGQFLPLDLWVPATNKIPPMDAHQYCLGYSLDFDKRYEFTAETYYKQMKNLIEYKEGANFTDMRIPWDEKVITDGKGVSYGLELFVQKKSGKLTGWVGYTLSQVERSFDTINNGKAFPYKFDKRHDLSIVAIYKLNDRINFSGSWVFSTGNAFTFPESSYPAAQNFIYPSENQNTGSVQYYAGRNAARMPNYHRLDLGVNFVKEKKHGIRTWNISVYNAYAHQNPFYIYATTDSNGNRKMKQIYMFSILPSFTYSYKF